MGGVGGFFKRPRNAQKRIDAQREQQAKALDGNVNGYLQSLLVTFNDRDSMKTSKSLEKLQSLLGQDFEIEQILLGGSVAKHTYIDGLSDVDGLVLLDRSELVGIPPTKLLKDFEKNLRDVLPQQDVRSIVRGTMSVTVTYEDGSEIQLLPALRIGAAIRIPNSDGKTWTIANPTKFSRQLTKANERLNSVLVPTIKLFKSLNSGLPEPKKMTGYHIESLSVEAVKGYRGPKTVKALLLHILDEASRIVLKPIKDVTGQSQHVDDYLGAAGSIKRRIVADALAGQLRRLNAATSIAQWKQLFED